MLLSDAMHNLTSVSYTISMFTSQVNNTSITPATNNSTAQFQRVTYEPETVDDVTNMPSTASNRTGDITWDDATWILTSSFIIFTMQSGFGLLEAGSVSIKNEINILVKNASDVIFGGITYWMFGYGLSFGEWPGWTNPFCGVGYFFVDTTDTEEIGIIYTNFIFQLSFATTATTIVSGAMAERTKLSAYILFSFLNTVVYSIPAHWVWASNGFLKTLGVVDIAGASGVHIVGGVSGLVGTLMLKPRIGRYDNGCHSMDMGNPSNAIVGMFMLWWGWLGFNCGSTFGISGGKWKLAAKSAVTTITSSMGGGIVGLGYSYVFKNRKFEIGIFINSILGALVAITASCAIARPWEAVVIGLIGGLVSILGVPLLDKMKIDDPVGAISVHAFTGIWGMLAVGLFAEIEPIEDLTQMRKGLFKGGGFYLLGIQLLACVVIIAWAAVTSFIILLIVQVTIGLRLTEEEETLGCDYVEHGYSGHLLIDITESRDDMPVGTMTIPQRRRSSFGLIRTDLGSIKLRNHHTTSLATVNDAYEAEGGNGHLPRSVL